MRSWPTKWSHRRLRIAIIYKFGLLTLFFFCKISNNEVKRFRRWYKIGGFCKNLANRELLFMKDQDQRQGQIFLKD